jgi:HEPN domain-containing protein
MSEVNDPRAWAERAEEDFELARSSLKRRKPFTASACFHAQQCAEKYIKALLYAVRTRYPGEEPTLSEAKEALSHA